MESEQEMSPEVQTLADQLAGALLPEVTRRIVRAQGASGLLGIFECEDYKCDSSFTCSEYKCSGGGFKCNGVFKISSQVMVGREFSATLGGGDVATEVPE